MEKNTGEISKTNAVIEAILNGKTTRHQLCDATGFSYKTVNGLVYALLKQERVKVTNPRHASCPAQERLKVVRKDPWPKPPAGLTPEVRLVMDAINNGKRTRPALKAMTNLAPHDINMILDALERSNWVKITNPSTASNDPEKARFTVLKAPVNPTPIQLQVTRDRFEDSFPSWCRTTPPAGIRIPRAQF